MDRQIITFSANEQHLHKTGGPDIFTTKTVSYIEAHFDLGENWSGFDSIEAVWWNDYVKPVRTVLDTEGICVVPTEVLLRKGAVYVNLVGVISSDNVLTDRLTTHPITAFCNKFNAQLGEGATTPLTPSEYEQFVATVKADADRAEAGATASANSAQNASESATASANSASDSAQSAIASAQSAQNASESAITAENAKDDAEDARDKILSMRATAETLEAGSDATASYSDGLLTLGIPRGDRGEQGIQGETGATPNLTIGTVETLEPTEDATATITGTAENPVLNLGIPKGDTGEVSLEDLEALLPTDTASGDIVTIPDGQSVIPAESLKVALNPIQSGSGTPSPDNVRPISGHTEVVTQRTGKNLFDISEVTEASVSTLGEIRGSTLITKRSGSYSGVYWLGWKQKLTENDVVSISADVLVPTQEGLTSKSVGFGIVKSDETNIGAYNTKNVSSFGTSEKVGGTVTVPKTGEYYIRLQGFGNVLNEIVEYSNIQLELGSTATAYEPYEANTYTTTLGRTVYGGDIGCCEWGTGRG